jgi:ADP-heptose:LPS heptosyltransferase
LLITPLIQEITTVFPNCKVDLFLKGGMGPTLFKNYNAVANYFLLPKKHFKYFLHYLKCWVLLKRSYYDIAINISQDSSSGRLSLQWARAKYKIYGEQNIALEAQYQDYNHFAKKTIYLLRLYLKGLDCYQEENIQIPNLNLILDTGEVNTGKNLLNKIVNNNKETIGIYTYATGSKCYTKNQWMYFYEKLNERYGNEYNIVEILPIENVSQIDFKGLNFYSTEIREIASLMRNMKIVISADCGMMHLASASSVTTIGLFKFNNMHKYRPYGNNSISLIIQNLEEEEIFTKIDNILGEKNMGRSNSNMLPNLDFVY